MKPVVTRLEIERPVEEVFAFLTDLENAGEWATGLIDVRHDGELRAGATGSDVRTVGRRQVEMPWQVTVFDAPRRVGFEYGDPFPATVLFTFEATSTGGTDVTCRTNLRPRGLQRLLAPLMAREARKVDEVQFRRAKELLESPATQNARGRS